MSSLEEQLEQKQFELENLQRSFDEYLESSKELESELEKSLTDAEVKLAASENKRHTLEEKLKSLQDQCSHYEKSQLTSHDEMERLKLKVESLEKMKIKYEIDNEDLTNQLRVLQSNEESMQHKIVKLEEEVVLATSEMDNMAIVSKDNERKLLDQIEDLVSKVSSAEGKAVVEEEASTTLASRVETVFQEESAPSVSLPSVAVSKLTEEKDIQTDIVPSVSLPEAAVTSRTEETSIPVESNISSSLKAAAEKKIPSPVSVETAIDLSYRSTEKTYRKVDEEIRVLDDDFVVKRKVVEALAQNDFDLMRTELQNMWDKYQALKLHNIKLLYKIQSLRGNIQVYCRTRPPLEHELSSGAQVIVDASNDPELLCFDAKTEFWKPFVFDRVWPADSTQGDVFLDVEPLVLSVLDGYNSCIMAYGQTGSGKTFTMEGAGAQLGVNYRSVLKIFEVLETRKAAALAQRKLRTYINKKSVQKPFSKSSAMLIDNTSPDGEVTVDDTVGDPAGSAGNSHNNSYFSLANEMMDLPPSTPRASSRKENTIDDEDVSPNGQLGDVDNHDGFRYTVELSLLEIYNEQVFDLLAESTDSNGNSAEPGALDIRQAPDGSVSVPGLRQISVSSAQEAIAVFQQGARQRATASTNLNEHSSRSHLVIQLDVVVEQETAVRGRLLLVDLAGSERVSKSGVTGAAMKEAQFINKSLLALGDVMEALDQKQKYVPYRNSKLTFLLQNALGGNSKSAMIVTLCPTQYNAEETLFTLHFASRVRNITLGAAAKYSNSKNLEVAVKNLRIELKELRRKKSLVDEALAEAKKDVKKVASDKAPQEVKLRSLEENKRAAELLMQQMSRQLHEMEKKLSEEVGRSDRLHNELDTTQKNMKKALDQIKDLLQEKERLNGALSNRERELESVQAALLRNMNHHNGSDHESSPNKGEKARVSFTLGESAIDNSPGVVEVKKAPERHIGNRFLAFTNDTISSKAKIAPLSPRNGNNPTVTKPSSSTRRESFPLSVSQSQQRSLLRQQNIPSGTTPVTPSKNTAPSVGTRTPASAKRTVSATTPQEAVRSARKIPQVANSSAESGRTPPPRPLSSSGRSLTPTMLAKRISTSDHSPQIENVSGGRSLTPTYVPFSPNGSSAANGSSLVREASSATGTTRRVLALNSRTEDALRRHQERMMSKRRDPNAPSTTVL